jgi:hypothetical protein
MKYVRQTSWHLIWDIRLTRVIENPDAILTATEIHNRWLEAVNGALQRDRFLTDKMEAPPNATL